MLKQSLYALALAVAPLAACTPQYAYAPAANATAQIKGQDAARYEIPVQAPTGDVRLASFGFSRVAAPGTPDDAAERVLHLRMIVANNSAQPWRLDTRQQLLDIEGVGRFAPAFASSHEGITGFPAVEIGAGARRSIDLFYRLPAGMNHARAVSQFDEVWRVELPEQSVVERTPFDRLRVTPTYAAGYGPYGYVAPKYGPLYPGYDGSLDIGAPTWY